MLSVDAGSVTTDIRVVRGIYNRHYLIKLYLHMISVEAWHFTPDKLTLRGSYSRHY